MKALMVNVTPAVAASIYSGKKYIPVRQIPNLGGEKDVTVYICEGDKVSGTAKYVGSKAQKEAFEGSVEDIYHLFVAWEVSDAQKYPEAKSYAEVGLKKSSLEWAYVNSK